MRSEALGAALEEIPCTLASLARATAVAARWDARGPLTVDSGINPHSATRTIKRREAG
jgi:hypothetical protein